MSGQTCLLLFMTVAQSAHQITSTDRVCQSFWASSWRVPNSHVEKVSAAMQVPFPELTELRLNLYDYDEWVSNGYQTASRPNPLRFVLGWIRSTSANFRADWHFVSGRDVGYCPLHIGQFCNTFALLRSRPGRARRRFTSPDMLCSPRSHS